MIVLPTDPVDPNNPRIGYHNVVESASAAASSAATGFPVTNLQNDLTFLYWVAADTSAQTLTFTLSAAAELSYVGIARHNLGTVGATYELEGSANGVDWTSVAGPQAPTDDGIIVHEFDPVSYQYWRLSLGAASEAIEIAVVYLGQILTLERRIYVGHTPLPFGLKSVVSTNRSESGQYLGRVIRRQFYETSIDLENMEPDTMRTEIQPFIDSIADRAFFWAWRPAAYPAEVGFVWAMGDVNPANQRANGMMQWNAAIQGIVE